MVKVNPTFSVPFPPASLQYQPQGKQGVALGHSYPPHYGLVGALQLAWVDVADAVQLWYGQPVARHRGYAEEHGGAGESIAEEW